MKEMWDLYDKNRNPLNKKVLRGTVLSDDEYHLVVYAWIKNSEGKYLISQRAKRKAQPLMWECTGGSVKSGENTYQGAIREVSEELGINIKNVPYMYIGQMNCYYKNCPYILDVYLFKLDIDITEITIQEKEVNDAMWATPDEILKLVHTNKFKATEFLTEILNQNKI